MTLSANLLHSLKSVCTDRELATYIKVAVIRSVKDLYCYKLSAVT